MTSIKVWYKKTPSPLTEKVPLVFYINNSWNSNIFFTSSLHFCRVRSYIYLYIHITIIYKKVHVNPLQWIIAWTHAMLSFGYSLSGYYCSRLLLLLVCGSLWLQLCLKEVKSSVKLRSGDDSLVQLDQFRSRGNKFTNTTGRQVEIMFLLQTVISTQVIH